MADQTKHVIAIKIGTPASPSDIEQSVRQHMTASIEGTLAAFSDAALSETRDVAKIRKLYKITDPNLTKSAAKKQYTQTNGAMDNQPKPDGDVGGLIELELVVLGMMALKGS